MKRISQNSRRCALYIRSAQASQVSIDMQRDLCTRYAERKGWRVVREYVDNGHSGASMKRPALQRMLAATDIDVVLVERIDRLTRSARDASAIHARLEARGVTVEALQVNGGTR
jgi:site-specific DNA recombinase